MAFKGVDSNDYSYFIVTEDFVKGGGYNQEAYKFDWSYLDPEELTWDFSMGVVPDAVYPLQNKTKLESLSSRDCIQKYTSRILSGRRNLLLVTDNGTVFIDEVRDANVIGFGHVTLSYYIEGQTDGLDALGFICSSVLGFNMSVDDYDIKSPHCYAGMVDASKWQVYGYDIKYCLSETLDERCTLQFSKILGIVIVICNATKVCCMLHAALTTEVTAICTLG